MRRVSLAKSSLGIAAGILLLTASWASAANDNFERSCDPDCIVKPPKENLFVRAAGDIEPSGATVQLSGTLLKGKKKTVVRVDVTHEYFSLSNQFRAMTVKINGKFPAPNFIVLNHIPACGPGNCVVSATYWFDIDGQESVYPGQFYGQPLVVTFDSSKAADANSIYNTTMAIAVVKKK